ncbi:DsrE family protein [Rubinisphaera sp. JC750]|uniref:DsrE family protein n=1 Tax=Rubinisphaera sp. JC750 TaxID=2898658 RepID=UPI001F1D438E|nr:DsrE family protein [Rubinisphaera sp. JC750]
MKTLRFLLCLTAIALFSTTVNAQGPGNGPRGYRGGRGPQHGGPGQEGHAGGQGHGRDAQHAADRDVFHFLLEHHEQIRRKVTNRPDGVETVTESDNPDVTAKIQEHVGQMARRVHDGDPIRMRDPLFAELFRHADEIKINYEKTKQGVKVTETSTNPRVVQLIQAHAVVVSDFVERGFGEASKQHEVPGTKPTAEKQKSTPVIPGHGAVIPLPDAAHQPRSGTKIVVDVTRGSEPDELNSAFEKVAKYLNIYAAAGKEPADVDLAVVLHGGATLAALHDDAYHAEFGIAKNPNLPLLRQLHLAGVKLYVCGQSLDGFGKSEDDVAICVQAAVSALTANVNLQSEGYAYIPLGK